MAEGHDRFDAQYWEARYSSHEAHSSHEPSPHLVTEVEHLPAGTALDAGCGEGRNALWLAGSGWRVTAVDISATALRRAREHAERRGPDVSDRVTWLRADLTTSAPLNEHFDLVTSLYVHPAGSPRELVDRLAATVAPNGTLLLVDHDRSDDDAQAHATVDELTAILDPDRWDVEVAERRGHDVVLRARRRTASSVT